MRNCDGTQLFVGDAPAALRFEGQLRGGLWPEGPLSLACNRHGYGKPPTIVTAMDFDATKHLAGFTHSVSSLMQVLTVVKVACVRGRPWLAFFSRCPAMKSLFLSVALA